jgi:hypothetical protein
MRFCYKVAVSRKLSKFSFSNCQNFPFQTVKISLFKLSKFPFYNSQNFPFANCQNFLFQTVKISLFKLSKFPFSNCQNFPFANCQNFLFQTVKIFQSKFRAFKASTFSPSTFLLKSLRKPNKASEKKSISSRLIETQRDSRRKKHPTIHSIRQIIHLALLLIIDF